MDDKATLQIVAAILAGHASHQAENVKPSSYVNRYIETLKELAKNKDEIAKALDDYDPELYAKLGK